MSPLVFVMNGPNVNRRATANRTSTGMKYWPMRSATGMRHPGHDGVPAFAGMTR